MCSILIMLVGFPVSISIPITAVLILLFDYEALI